jgi:hypothetical protein
LFNQYYSCICSHEDGYLPAHEEKKVQSCGKRWNYIYISPTTFMQQTCDLKYIIVGQQAHEYEHLCRQGKGSWHDRFIIAHGKKKKKNTIF